MHRLNQIWRIARSVYRTKFIGQIETQTKSYHIDEASKKRFVCFTCYDKDHYYTIGISEEALRDALEHFHKNERDGL